MTDVAEQNITGELVYLVAEDFKAAASLLYQTYHDDELFKRIFRAEKPDYDKRLRAAIREDLTSFWESGQPIVGIKDGDTLLGVACLTRPGASFGPDRLALAYLDANDSWFFKYPAGAGKRTAYSAGDA